MNIIFIIYIFTLFVITSPNVLIKFPKMNKLVLAILHGLIFLCVVYFTQEFFMRYREGVKIGTIDTNGNEKDLYMSTYLGLDKLIKPNTSPDESNVVNVNNTILDYSNYDNKLKKEDPLPGPIPDFFGKDLYNKKLYNSEQVELAEQLDIEQLAPEPEQPEP